MHDAVAIELAERQHGVVAHWQLIDRDVSYRNVRLLSETRHWEQIRQGVLRRVGSGSSEPQRVLACLLDVGKGAVLSHESSANWWGLTGCRLWPIQLVTLSKSRRQVDRAVRHEVRRLPPRWVTELGGIPIARPELTALHLFAANHYERAERLTESLWSRRLLSGESLAHLVSDLGRSGRNGITGLRRFLEDRPGPYVPPATGIESRVSQILRQAGIDVECQVNVGDVEHWTGRVDFKVRGRPIVIEVQSQRHHQALTDARSDAERRAALESAGFVWVEVWDVEVWTDPDAVRAKVLAAIRAFDRR